MPFSRPASARRADAVRMLSLLVLSGCLAESPTSPPIQAPGFARGGGSGPTIRSTDPDTGLRNTTLDVRVLGSGYDNGSRAVWALAGDTSFATTKVRTNSSQFVNSGELVANITIAADAPLAIFDVVVITLAGKKGIGIEKFTVKETGQYSALFSDAPGDKLRGDNGTVYQDGGPDYSLNCVLSLGSNAGGGLYQLRTIHSFPTCRAVPRPGWRFFKFDFGAPAVDLDQDGVVEAIEDAPGRILVSSLGSGTSTTLVKILIFVVNPDGSTTWDARWSLHFRTALQVRDGGAGGRVLQATAGAAMVDIYAGYVDIPIKKTTKPVATVQCRLP